MLVSFTNHHLLAMHYGLYVDAHQTRIAKNGYMLRAGRCALVYHQALRRPFASATQGGAQDLCAVRNIGVE